jgi:hypothetical protein
MSLITKIICSRLDMSLFAGFHRSLIYSLMKPAVLEFQRNRVKRQPSDAASTDILNTILELRSTLRSVKRAITAVERRAIARYGEEALKPRKSVAGKRRAASAKPKIQLVRFPYPAQETGDTSYVDYAAQIELDRF